MIMSVVHDRKNFIEALQGDIVMLSSGNIWHTICIHSERALVCLSKESSALWATNIVHFLVY